MMQCLAFFHPRRLTGLMTMKTVESYDYRSGKWESGSSMRETRADLSCCVVGDYLYAFGGR